MADGQSGSDAKASGVQLTSVNPMKRFILTLLACGMLISLSACNSATDSADHAVEDHEEFWSHRYSMQPDIEYGDHPSQKLDLYLQGSWRGEPDYFEQAPDPRPTLLFIHGGGWVAGQKEGMEIFFLHFIEQGWNVVNMTYRLGADTAPEAVDDAVCALAWVASASHIYGFDREKIVVSGVSAGGHLALVTGILGSRPGHDCYVEDDFRVGAVINWFGITDIEAVDTFLDQTMPDQNYARDWIGDEERVESISNQYSPVAIVDSGSPPVITIHGEDDSVVPYDQAVTFHAKLDELGIRNSLQSMPGGRHMGFTDDQFQQAWREIFQFLSDAGMEP